MKKTSSKGPLFDDAFAEVIGLIREARQRAVKTINTELINLYWRIGKYVHQRIKTDGWAKGTVEQLAIYIARSESGLRGFSAQNLWRMRQFYEVYPHPEKLSTPLRELLWSSQRRINSRTRDLLLPRLLSGKINVEAMPE